MIPKRQMIPNCGFRIVFVRGPQSTLCNHRHHLMLAFTRRRVFGEEKSEPETEILRTMHRLKSGAEDKCRPSRYYSDPLPV
jgi:hypothetical protein